MLPEVTLSLPTIEDIHRMVQWLDDAEVNSSWYGLGEDGRPLHIGYSPHRIFQAPSEEWQRVFEDEDRKIYSVYTTDGEHIGEGQLPIASPRRFRAHRLPTNDKDRPQQCRDRCRCGRCLE